MMLWNISGRGEARGKKRADPSEALARVEGYEKAKERWERAQEEQIASQLNDDLERVESDKSDKGGEGAQGSGEAVVATSSKKKSSSLDDFSPSETLVWGKDGRLESNPAGYAQREPEKKVKPPGKKRMLMPANGRGKPTMPASRTMQGKMMMPTNGRGAP